MAVKKIAVTVRYAGALGLTGRLCATTFLLVGSVGHRLLLSWLGDTGQQRLFPADRVSNGTDADAKEVCRLAGFRCRLC